MVKIKSIIRIVTLFVIACFYLPPPTSYGQTNGTASVEELYARARENAFNSRRPEARSICRQILLMDSTYHDAAVLMGRTYAWDASYDSARWVLQQVIKQKAGFYDAIDALIDVELWSDHNTAAIGFAETGLKFHPDDAVFLYKKARALNNSGNSPSAVSILNQLLKINPENKEASGLLSSIRTGSLVNKVTLNGWAYAFDHEDPWSFASVAVGRKTTRFGTVTLRYNYARRFGNDGNQFEIDAYPSIAKGVYMYVNTGISNKKNFPFTRLSLEPYFKLPAGFELSTGFRYLNFDEKRMAATDSNKVLIYTGTIGKYKGDYWFSVRTYLTPGKEKWSKSVNLTIRRYLADSDSYISLILGTGFSPDEQQFAFNPQYYLKSSKIDLDYQQKLGKRYFLNLGTGFAREEIRTNVKRNRYSLDLGVSCLF